MITDKKLCCDCLRDLSKLSLEQFEQDVIRRSQMSDSEKAKLDRQFDGAGLFDVYLCRSCYETRFTRNR